MALLLTQQAAPPRGAQLLTGPTFRIATVYTTVVSTLLTIAPAPPPKPFAQIDWPNPRGTAPVIVLRDGSRGHNLNLIGQDALPLRQLDWPVPKAPKPVPQAHLDQLKLTLVGQDRLPFRNYWTVPPGPKLGSISLKTWTESYKLSLIGLDALPFVQDEWPVPAGLKRSVYWLQSGNALTDSAVVQTPFNQFDWSVPRGRPLTFGIVDQPRQLLDGQDVLPFNRADWPVPKGKAPTSGWIDQLTTQLVGQDALPVRNEVTTVPKGRQPVPFGWTESYKLTLVGQDFLPFSQDDWPVPASPVRARADWIQLPPLSLSTIVTIPFNQTVWPVPRGARPIAPSWVDIKVNMIGLDVLPFRNDWTVPAGPRERFVRSWTDPFRLTLIGRDALPIRQQDWPVPKGPPPPRADCVKAPPLSISVLVVLPFNTSDWPNPRGAIPGIALRTHLDSYKLPLVGQDLLPIRQQDWPLPRGARRSGDLGVTLNGPALNFVLPFVQTDWPVPRGFVPGVSLRTWIDPTKLALIGRDALPVRQQEWPVPRGAQPGISLKTDLNQLRLLVGQDALTAARNFYSWPNPRGPQPINLGFAVIPGSQLITATPVAGIFTHISAPKVVVTFGHQDAYTKVKYNATVSTDVDETNEAVTEVQNTVGKKTTIIVS